MNHELCIFLSTIAGEAGRCGAGSWQAVACSIMNRVDDKKREWKRMNTVFEVISKSGYDAYVHKNKAYRDAFGYFENKPHFKANPTLDSLQRVVEPIFNRAVRPYPTVVMYFSPMAMIAFHQAKPELYKSARPNWNFEVLKRVEVPGARQDDMDFYAYK